MGGFVEPSRGLTHAQLPAKLESPRARVPFLRRTRVFSCDNDTRGCARQVLSLLPRCLRQPSIQVLTVTTPQLVVLNDQQN